MTRSAGQPTTIAERLSAAVNSHEVERVVELFTDDYVNETPIHPSRNFTGREQVRRNWSQIFAGVPDVEAVVLRSDQVGDQVWSEWEMRGTRVDGIAHLMRGMMRFTVEGDRASAVRFYLEPVDASEHDADESVRRLLTSPRR
jgi:ketosteroid isomerase-like protein